MSITANICRGKTLSCLVVALFSAVSALADVAGLSLSAGGDGAQRVVRGGDYLSKTVADVSDDIAKSARMRARPER